MNYLNHSPKTLAPRFFGAAILLALAGIAGSALAAVRYVDVNSANATPPYTNWPTAGTKIQDAVDAAVAGDEIVVTNGIYATGARVVFGTTNRVVVDKPLIVRSVNGQQFTTLDGGGSVRCVYLTNGASLSGFTLTNGGFASGPDGGGVFGESVAAAVSYCTLSGNLAYRGGGAAGCTLNNCILGHNRAIGYSVGEPDGDGGGAYNATLNSCTLTGNRSAYVGGGADGCILNNCALSGNSADAWGGGAYQATLNNCTLAANSAYSGGGAYNSTLNNCIVYFNSALQGANYDSSTTLSYSCTTPLPTGGAGNISWDPQLASSSHLSAVSPCRGAGSAAYASDTDIDGEARASPPSIGCDEYRVGAVTGPLSVGIAASLTNVATGFTVQLTALIEGRTTASSWNFGDGTAAINQPYASHAWMAAGDYAVILRAYNESQPAGISAALTVHVVNAVHYVATGSPNPVAPYTSWATAATNIQDAVDAATVPGALVLVTDGIYATGGRPAVGEGAVNPVTLDKPLRLQSVNGPRFTTIDGGRFHRCVCLASNANLSGFTLSNGFSQNSGGGVFGGTAFNATLNNCILTGNSCSEADGGGASHCTLNNCSLTGNSAYYGGGASECILNDCTLLGNSAGQNWGGGVSGCTLNNCTLSGNTARVGGGVYSAILNNCIVYFNTAGQGANYDASTLNYCCTTPQPSNGLGNIINAPLFVDLAAGNFRLQSSSPCINTGNNAFVTSGTDLDGRQRIAGGTVDIGAYEFQVDVSGVFIGWLQQYALPTDGSADTADTDGDGLNNSQEWRCGTDPTNSLSVLRLLAPVTAGTNVTVSWQSVAGVNYFLERATSLSAPPAFTSLATKIPGQPGTTKFVDTNTVGAGPLFYRVGVGN